MASFRNANTRFGKFSWAEHPKLRDALLEAKKRLGPEYPNAKRFKINLGAEKMSPGKLKKLIG